MNQQYIPYAKTNKFSQLVLDWLYNQESISPFFENYPDLKGFRDQVEQKSSFSSEHRKILVKQLKAQYESLQLASEEREELYGRIDLLSRPNTFTVTTGHQLCLFTGPLYTVYKILHVIRLAEELTQNLKGTTVLPIFWMATEDHDFDEVNHVRYGKHKLVWHAQSGDAVGRMDTHAIEPVINDLANRLPKGEHTNQILADLKSAYLEHGNLADATRCLVHLWFGKYGIIALDGDDMELKKLMIPAFSKELTQQSSFHSVNETNTQLEARYSIQVTPREINLFYLNNGIRSRIVEEDAVYNPMAEEKNWTRDEVLKELQNHPDRFSPNVILRPLYQETILPNLGYIGGGGEVAYWSELKSMFSSFEVPFPIIVLRQSVQLVPKRIARKVAKLDLSYEELFAGKHQLAISLIKRNCDFDDEFEQVREQLDLIYNRLKEVGSQVDSTLLAHVEAQRTRTLNQLENTEKKVYRAAKRNDDDLLRMLDETYDVIFPGGGLQERHDNIIEHLINFGPSLMDEIYRNIHPLQLEFLVLAE